jgi:hypothetical protein
VATGTFFGRRFRGRSRFVQRRGFILRIRLGMMSLVTAPVFFPARLPRLLLIVRRRLHARRLDAAQGAAQFLDFALIGQFLALGEFDEFEDFLKLIEGVLQRFGDLGGVQDGRMDGRSVSRAEIRGTTPLALAWLLRFITLGAFLPFVALRTFRTFAILFLAWWLRLGWRLDRCICGRFGAGRDIGHAHGGFLGVRLAKAAGWICLVLSHFRRWNVLAGFDRGIGHRGSGRETGWGGFTRKRAWCTAAAAATTTATSAAATDGSARRGG